jgi:hypothetical protein
MAIMKKDNLPPKSSKPDDARKIGILELRAYYLNKANELDRQAVETELKNPDSELNAVLRWLKRDWSPAAEALLPEKAPLAPRFPRLADLPQEELVAARMKSQRGNHPPPKAGGPFRLIGPRNPDVPGVNRDGGGRGPS